MKIFYRRVALGPARHTRKPCVYALVHKSILNHLCTLLFFPVWNTFFLKQIVHLEVLLFPPVKVWQPSLVVKAITNQTGLSWNTSHVIIAYLNLNRLVNHSEPQFRYLFNNKPTSTELKLELRWNISVYVSVLLSQFIPSFPSPSPVSIWPFSMSASLFFSGIGSSVPFF